MTGAGIHTLLLASALAATAPAAAQAGSSVQAEADHARLAIAETLAERLWPGGTYARMMTGTYQSMAGSLLGVGPDPAAIASQMGLPAPAKTAEGKTLLQLAREADPHVDERLRLTNQVLEHETALVLSRFDPEVRAALSRSLAQKFTAGQLRELSGFFATPTGHAFAGQTLLLAAEPSITQVMLKATPAIWSMMSAIAPKVKAATAHLPPRPDDGSKARRTRPSD